MSEAAIVAEIHAATLDQSRQLATLTEEMRSMRQEIRVLKDQLATNADRHVPPTIAMLPPPMTKKLTSSTTMDPFFAAALRRAHPMYVVSISTLLAPSFQHFRPHEELKAAGMLVEWHEGMGKVIFISHTWLRFSHPDSEACDKFNLLTGLLHKIQAGQLNVECEVMAQTFFGTNSKKLRLKAADLQRDLADGFVFFDYMSIPQADPEAQQRAVVSLGSYVSASSYFFVLAGPWRHENGTVRDDLAWVRRGWCRMELVANALSPAPKPMVLAKSLGSVVANMPGGTLGHDWLGYAHVGMGDFSVEADRRKLGVHLLDIINARKAFAKANGDLIFYRMLHTLTPRLVQGTGVEETLKIETVDEWMASMRFSSARDGTSTGITPLFAAVCSHRVDIAEQMLAEGANPRLKMQVTIPKYFLKKGDNLLAACLYLGNGKAMVDLLMRHGADTRAKSPGTGLLPFGAACFVGNIAGAEALLDHDPSLFEGVDLLGLPCAAYCSGSPHGRAIFDFARRRFPERMDDLIRGKLGNYLNPMGLSFASHAVWQGNVEVMLALLDEHHVPIEAGGGVNGAAMGIMITVADLVVRMRRSRKRFKLTPMVFWSLSSRCTVLHSAAFHGNLQALEAVLERSADVNTTKHRWRMTPLCLAAVLGHEQICAALLRAGATVDVKDAFGRTPLSWARQLGHEEISQLLLAAQRRLQQRSTTKHAPTASTFGFKAGDRVLPPSAARGGEEQEAAVEMSHVEELTSTTRKEG